MAMEIEHTYFGAQQCGNRIMMPVISNEDVLWRISVAGLDNIDVILHQDYAL